MPSLTENNSGLPRNLGPASESTTRFGLAEVDSTAGRRCLGALGVLGASLAPYVAPGFVGDPSIFAPCSLDISKRAKQAVGNKDLLHGESQRSSGRRYQPSSPAGDFQQKITNRSCGLASPRAILARICACAISSVSPGFRKKVWVRRPLARTCSARSTWRTRDDFMARHRNCRGCPDRSARAVLADRTDCPHRYRR